MKRNDILTILIPLCIFAFAWIGFSIYHNIVTSTISEPLSMQIAPIDPTFDTDAVNSLRNRQKVSPIYELSVPVQNLTIPASSSASSLTTTTVNSLGNFASPTKATSEGRLTP